MSNAGGTSEHGVNANFLHNFALTALSELEIGLELALYSHETLDYCTNPGPEFTNRPTKIRW